MLSQVYLSELNHERSLDIRELRRRCRGTQVERPPQADPEVQQVQADVRRLFVLVSDQAVHPFAMADIHAEFDSEEVADCQQGSGAQAIRSDDLFKVCTKQHLQLPRR